MKGQNRKRIPSTGLRRYVRKSKPHLQQERRGIERFLKNGLDLKPSVSSPKTFANSRAREE